MAIKPMKLLFSIIIFAAALVLVYLVSNAFFVWKVMDVPGAEINATPEDALLLYENVEFSAPGGPILKGWMIKGDGGSPVIIGCHDLASNKQELLSSVVRLNKVGYGILLFDFRGHAESEGKTTLGAGEIDDVTAAVAFAENYGEKPTERIGLWGIGMGAYAAVGAAREKEDVVKAMALDSPYTEIAVYLDYLIKTRHSLDFFHPRGSRIMFSLFTARFSSPDLLDITPHLDRMNMLFLAEENSPAFKFQAMALYEASPEAGANLKLMTKTRLSSLYDEDKKTYDDVILQFFQSFMPVESMDVREFEVIVQ